MNRQRDGYPALEPAAPSPITFGLRKREADDRAEWALPVEVALALPSSARSKAFVQARLAHLGHGAARARVFVRGKRFFVAEVFYEARKSVLYPLDLWTAPAP